MPLSHVNQKGEARMVDISSKRPSVRTAEASARIHMQPETLRLIAQGDIPKGDVFAAARIAGILAAKKVDQLIPLCHSIPLEGIEISFHPDEAACCVHIAAAVRCTYKTGAEMEALTAVAAAALTVYDMCKAVDKGMIIGDLKLLKKTGGKNS
jgi:cyclic pyranopterin phosphate synthase